MAENEAVRRLQASIDLLKERMRIDSNDLEYESHLRQDDIYVKAHDDG